MGEDGAGCCCLGEERDVGVWKEEEEDVVVLRAMQPASCLALLDTSRNTASAS